MPKYTTIERRILLEIRRRNPVPYRNQRPEEVWVEGDFEPITTQSLAHDLRLTDAIVDAALLKLHRLQCVCDIDLLTANSYSVQLTPLPIRVRHLPNVNAIGPNIIRIWQITSHGMNTVNLFPLQWMKRLAVKWFEDKGYVVIAIVLSTTWTVIVTRWYLHHFDH